MTRAAFVLNIKPDKVAEYVEAHANVWPEMRAAISASGIRNYSIFLDGSRVFGYYETDDIEASRVYLAASEVNDRWQNAMEEYLEGRVEDGGPATLKEVFRLD